MEYRVIEATAIVVFSAGAMPIVGKDLSASSIHTLVASCAVISPEILTWVVTLYRR